MDVDRDGLVDLLVCNYVQWSPQTDLYCGSPNGQKTYCTPQAYRGSTSWLFRNRGQGRFEDVTALRRTLLTIAFPGERRR